MIDGWLRSINVNNGSTDRILRFRSQNQERTINIRKSSILGNEGPCDEFHHFSIA